jgi:uncharacterized protein YdaU (DUF1376 family)
MEWYPWYFELYAADTRHLSCIEHGAYRLLLDEYMRYRQPLPDNDRVLARIACLPMDEWTPISGTIRAFFHARNGKLHQERCDIELDRQDRQAGQRSEIAKKGADARWGKNKELDADSNADSNAGGMLEGMLLDATTHHRTSEDSKGIRQGVSLETSPPSHTRSPGRVNGSGEAASDQFEVFWRAYPSRSPHPNPKKLARAKFEAAIKRGVDPVIIVAGAERYAKYAAGERTDPRYIPQAATWLSQERWTEPYSPRSSRPNGPMKFEG